MAFIFRYSFDFVVEILDVINCWVGYSVFEVEVGATGGGDGDFVSFLVLVDHVPECVGTVLFLEADGHDFALSDLDPFDAV